MFAGISIWQLLIVLVIILLVFGTKKLRNIGQDLGGAVKGFKEAVKEGEQDGSKTLEQRNDTTASKVAESQPQDQDKN